MTDGFDLALNVDSSPTEVLSVLAELAGGKLNDEGELFMLPELWASVRSVHHPVTREVYQDVWGIDMPIAVSFSLGYKFDFDNRYPAIDLMSVSAAKLANALDCDAGMLHDFDRKIMRRSDSVLYLYDWWPQWSDLAVQAQLPNGFVITDADSSA